MKPEDLNPENDPEVRITALLLGELTREEETELRAVMAQNPELMRLHDRLKVVMGLVKDAVPTTEPLTQSLPEPMTLAEERRAELLAVFKGQAPKPKEKKVIKVSFWQRQKADLLKLAAMLVGLLAATWMMLPKREQGTEFFAMLGKEIKGVAPRPTGAPAAATFATTAAEVDTQPSGEAFVKVVTQDLTTDAVTVNISNPTRGDAGGRQYVYTTNGISVVNDSVNLSFAARAGVPLTASEPAIAKLDDSMNRSARARGSQIALPALIVTGGEQEVAQRMMTDQGGGVSLNNLNISRLSGSVAPMEGLILNDPIAGKPMASPGQSPVGSGGVGGGGASGQTHWAFGEQNGRRGGELADGPKPGQTGAWMGASEHDFVALPQSQVTQLGLADSRKLGEITENKPRESERLARTEPAITGNSDVVFSRTFSPSLLAGPGGTQPSQPANEYAMGRTVQRGQVVERGGDRPADTYGDKSEKAAAAKGTLGIALPGSPLAQEMKIAAVSGRYAAQDRSSSDAEAKEKAPNQTVNGPVAAGITVDINGGARGAFGGEMKGLSQLGAAAKGVTLNYDVSPEMPQKSGAVAAQASNYAFYTSPAAQPAPLPQANKFTGSYAYTLPEGKTLSADQKKDSLAENGTVHAFGNGERAKMANLGDVQNNLSLDGSTPNPLPQKPLQLKLNRGMALADMDGDGQKMPSQNQDGFKRLSELQKQDGFNLDVIDLTVAKSLDEGELSKEITAKMDLVSDGTVALKSEVAPLPATPSSWPVDALAKGKKQEVSQMVQDAKLPKASEFSVEELKKEAAVTRRLEVDKIKELGVGKGTSVYTIHNHFKGLMDGMDANKSLDNTEVKDLHSAQQVLEALAAKPSEVPVQAKFAEVEQEKLAKLKVDAKDEAVPQRPPAAPPGIPQPEVSTAENAFSTFSLNVSDVSFKLAAASLEKGLLPEPATVRTEEFINAFNYHDAEPTGNARVAFAWERARYPFAHDRDLVRFAVKTGAVGREPGKPLNIVLLLDNSGSMERADRVQIRRECLRVLGGQLQAQDTVSVVAFARTARLWVDGLAGNKAEELQERVGNLTPEGGTNLEEAMNLAYATAQKHFVPNGVNRVVLLTDGAANLGDVSPDSLKKKVVSYRQQGVALDCFGIGWEGYNDDLLEALSRNGDGRYGFVNSPEAATTEFASQLAGALQVAASDVKVQVEWNPKRVTVFRQLGYAKHQLKKEEFRDNKVDAAEIGAAEAGNALYTVQVNPAGEGPLGVVRVRYRVPNTSDYREHEWTLAYDGASKPMEQSSVPLRLAATASAFSEWLVASPFAGEVTPEGLITQLSGVPEAYPADPRPKQLEWMIRQAKSLSGR